MVDQWSRFQQRVALEQDTAYGFPTATFYNYTQGNYDPNTGEMTGQTRSQVAQETVEFVPPTVDSSVDTDGSSFSWDTSIRFADTDSVADNLVPYGEDAEQPTEVEVLNPADGSTTVYQLQGYSVETGSGMVMCRLTEL